MKTYQIIEQLTAASTDEAKKIILQAAFNAGQMHFFEGLRIALDPYITFAIRTVPEYQLDGTESDDDLHLGNGYNWPEFVDLIGKLNKRFYSQDDAKKAVRAAADKASIMEWNNWYRLILTKNVPVSADLFNTVLTENNIPTVLPRLVGQYPTIKSQYPRGEQYLDMKLKFRMFAVLDTNNKSVKLFTNDGKENYENRELVHALIKLLPELPGGIVLDAGLVHRSEKDYFNTSVTDKRHLAVFDVIPLSDFARGKCDIVLKDRMEVLSALASMFQKHTDGLIYVGPKQVVNLDDADGINKYKEFAKLAPNGVLVKNPASPYTAGQTADWVEVVNPKDAPLDFGKMFTMSAAAPVSTVPDNNVRVSGQQKNGNAMNYAEIYEYIEQIAANPSKNAKEALVAGKADDENFRNILRYTYDPFYNYGIIPLQPQSTNFSHSPDHQWNALTWKLLDDLRTRKLTGNNARIELDNEFRRLNFPSGQLLWRVIRKDLRAGFSDSTINKSIKGLLPEFPYMRCSGYSEKLAAKFDWRAGCLSQKKADGLFANVDFVGDVVAIRSRQGSPFPIEKFSQLVDDVKATLKVDTQTHGEFIVRRAGKTLPREIGNGILNSVLKGGDFGPDEIPVYQIWDQIPISAVVKKGKYEVPYTKRFAAVSSQVAGKNNTIEIIETEIVYSIDDAMAHYRKLLAAGEEGTVLKDSAAIWRDGTSTQQLKLKLEVTVDLQIIGFVPGNGKNANTFGSITVQSSDGLLEVDVSGFGDAERLRLHQERDNILGKIMSVTANAITTPSNGGKYSLFLPRVAESVRTDKTVADSLQSIQEQFAAAVK